MSEPLWIWEEKLKRYRETATGRFIGATQMNNLRADFLVQQKAEMGKLAESYRLGQIDIYKLESQVKSLLKQTYIDNYAMGAGGRNNMTSSDWGKIGSMLKKQYGEDGYLGKFMKQIGEGQLSEAQIKARLDMYANSSTQSLWRGYTRDMPMNLPAYPGDGSTICRTNCQCEWDIQPLENGYDCYWRLGAAEHCPDCLDRASKWKPYKIRWSEG